MRICIDLTFKKLFGLKVVNILVKNTKELYYLKRLMKIHKNIFVMYQAKINTRSILQSDNNTVRNKSINSFIISEFMNLSNNHITTIPS